MFVFVGSVAEAELSLNREFYFCINIFSILSLLNDDALAFFIINSFNYIYNFNLLNKPFYFI